MPREVLAAAALDELRLIDDPPLAALFGDPKVEDKLRHAVRQHGLKGAAAALAGSPEGRALLVECHSLAVKACQRVQPDPAMLRHAQGLFGRYAPEICGALLLAALPQSYATKFGANVLSATRELETDLVRRVRGTAQFLLVVTQPAATDDAMKALWSPPGAITDLMVAGTPWQVCTALRLYHQTIRHRVAGSGLDFGGQPLNQEDLLGMLLTFSVSVFEVLERYGISWTADDQEAYLHLWDVIGAYLGIGSTNVIDRIEPKVEAHHLSMKGWQGLRPSSIADTRTLLTQIRNRQWTDPQPTSLSYTVGVVGPSSLTNGRLLASALLDELANAMPPSLKLLPVTMMRTLAPDIVRQRLSLGHNGIVLRALDQLPRRRNVVDRFTTVSTPNWFTGRVLRTMANEVATRATVRFLHDPNFVIPGQEDWSRAFGRCD